MDDFLVLQFIKISSNHRNFDKIEEVLRQPPALGWIKVNTYGSSMGFSNNAAIWVIFRDHNTKFLGVFSKNIGASQCLFSKFYDAMYVIKKAKEICWRKI